MELPYSFCAIEVATGASFCHTCTKEHCQQLENNLQHLMNTTPLGVEDTIGYCSGGLFYSTACQCNESSTILLNWNLLFLSFVHFRSTAGLLCSRSTGHNHLAMAFMARTYSKKMLQDSEFRVTPMLMLSAVQYLPLEERAIPTSGRIHNHSV